MTDNFKINCKIGFSFAKMSYIAAICIVICFYSIYLYAEEQTTITNLDEILVTATRTEKGSIDTPNMVYTQTSETLKNEKMVRTTPEALKEIPGIMVQKTSHGQGSPIIRGFTGFRTLFLIDGIRLNNSVFRDGPNQYWNTVDPFSIDKLEATIGPGSVLYGSDAVGGTVQALTVHPKYQDGKYISQGRLYGRYADAENSYIGRGEIGGSYKNTFGWIIGTSYKDFGELEAGNHVGKQPKTGYDEWDGDIKVEYFLNSKSRFVIAHQNVNLDDAWRTHKTIYGINWREITNGNELMRVLDQDRKLTYLQYYGNEISSLIDNLIISLSYHKQEEVQYRVRSDLRSDYQGFDVGTTGLWCQANSAGNYGTLTYGFEYYRDDVDSYLKKYASDGSFSGTEIQGPVADNATYDSLGIFLQNDIFISNSIELITGIRYSYFDVDADKIRDPETGEEISFSKDWNSFVGSIRTVYHIDQDNHYKIFCGISQSFRAPSLSDLTRFDTARSGEIETAAFDLDPEKYITYEMGLKTALENFSSQLSYFYTDIEDMIVRKPTGNIIDGDNEVTKKNAGNGYIHGIELCFTYRIFSGINVFGSFAWLDGEVDTYPTSSPVKNNEPIDRLMPATYHGGISWKPTENFWIEGFVTIADNQDKLSTRDKSDTDRIPPGGTPGYTVYDIRSGWNMNNNFTLTAALENITDKDYRIHGSGLNEPGRNLIVALDCRF